MRTRLIILLIFVVVCGYSFGGCQGQLAKQSYENQSELTIEALDACETVFWKLLDRRAPKVEPCYLGMPPEN